MKDKWLNDCLQLGLTAGYNVSCRRIHHNITLEYPLNDSLQLSDAGYTSAKLKQLIRHYFQPESHATALRLWANVKAYGSVGITTYNHLIKSEKKSIRSSVMGPCIQAVTITKAHHYQRVDVFYRTTELCKKFPADLVFIRDVILKPFELTNPILTCHFANVTLHPMYLPIVLAHTPEPVAYLKKLDERMHHATCRWLYSYLVDDTAIQKFSQARSSQKNFLDLLSNKSKSELVKYVMRVKS